MTNHLSWSMLLALAGATAACAGETDLILDAGSSQEAGQQDQAVYSDWGQLDQSVGGTSCNEVLDCVAACDTTTCADECIEAGSPGAQVQINALISCQSVARGDVCKAECPTATAECFACVERVCGTEQHDCLFGKPFPGFGDRCDAVTECVDILTCAGQASTGQGYCTYACETPQKVCLGAPAETYASCITSVEGGGFVCGFICKKGLTSYQCPAPQVCSTAEAPPAGSGVYLCEAPAI